MAPRKILFLPEPPSILFYTFLHLLSDRENEIRHVTMNNPSDNGLNSGISLGGSPFKVHGSGTMNFQSATPTRDSCLAAMMLDVKDHITYDDPSVFSRLGITPDYIKGPFITACTKAVQEDCANHLQRLISLCAQAKRVGVKKLEEDEKESSRSEDGGNRGSKQEREMYHPLVSLLTTLTGTVTRILTLTIQRPSKLKLFTYITQYKNNDYPEENVTPKREIVMTNTILKPNEPHTVNYPSVIPDFTGIVYGSKAKSPEWGIRDFFGEVKPTVAQGPKGRESTVRPIMSQCANYARLFMTGKPNMLFAIGFLIYGLEFCLGNCDRGGISLSPSYDMTKSLDVFVAVVRRLTHGVSDQDLGFDPSVRPLTIEQTRTLIKDDKAKVPSKLVQVPTVGAPVGTTWCTIGHPIWVSQSLFGRGTNVWRVRRYNHTKNTLEGPMMVMKTSWRNSGRHGESEIYQHLSNKQIHIHGLAQFEMGGDVFFPDPRDGVISVKTLRDQEIAASDSPTTPILHRLVLKSIGKPMWEYDSDKQLMNAFRDVIQAHKDLYCNAKFLHRDISAGNMLLNTDEAVNCHGILSDLEFALPLETSMRIPSVTTEVVGDSQTRTHIVFDSKQEIKRGAVMTGTAQFMAHDLLDGTATVHEVKHDLEAFIWSFSYCVWKKLYMFIKSKDGAGISASQKAHFMRNFDSSFSQTNPTDIAEHRLSGSAALTFVTKPAYVELVNASMSQPLIDLFKQFRTIMNSIHDPNLTQAGTPVLVTHDVLLNAVDKAITSCA